MTPVKNCELSLSLPSAPFAGGGYTVNENKKCGDCLMHKSFTLSHTDNIELNLYQYGEENCAKGHSFGPAVRRHYLFHYVISGHGVLHSEFGAFPVAAGEGFLIYPQDVTTYCADPRDPWHYMWLEVDGLIAGKMFEECRLSRRAPVYRPAEYGDEPDTLRYLRQIIAQGERHRLTAIGLCYLFFSALVTSTPQGAAERQSDRTQHLRKAVKYLENRYHEPLTVAGLAAYCNLNRSHLCRLFKQEFGVGPKEYLLKLRMNIAVSLLCNSQTAIKVVGISVGYENQLHFSKAFKQVYGLSPAKWRLQNQPA